MILATLYDEKKPERFVSKADRFDYKPRALFNITFRRENSFEVYLYFVTF